MRDISSGLSAQDHMHLSAKMSKSLLNSSNILFLEKETACLAIISGKSLIMSDLRKRIIKPLTRRLTVLPPHGSVQKSHGKEKEKFEESGVLLRDSVSKS